MSDKPELSIVAPCFNEEQVLPEFLRRATAAAEQCGKSFEILIVDDGEQKKVFQCFGRTAEDK